MAEIDLSSAKPHIVVQPDNLPATARDLVPLLFQSGRIFDRGFPVKIVPAAGAGFPRVEPMTPSRVVNEAHELARPVGRDRTMALRGQTLPDRVARLYLALDDWGLPPLKGITSAPLLAADGSIRATNGYDARSGFWCVGICGPDGPSAARRGAEVIPLSGGRPQSSRAR